MKRGAGGRRRSGGGNRRAERGRADSRRRRGGEGAAKRGRAEIGDPGGAVGRRSRRGHPQLKGSECEGRVVGTEPPGAHGQRVEVEDAEGCRWSIECLGEPVAVGTRILFAPLSRRAEGSSRRGELLRCLDRERPGWVARVLRLGRHRGITLVPFSGADCPRLRLDERDAKGAEHGDRVWVEPLEAAAPPGRHARGRRHRGAPRSDGLPVRVVQVFGAAGTPDADHAALVWKHRLPGPFSRRARLEAEALDPSPRPEESIHRIDLRHLPFVTIDPASARDHDDAVCAERRTPAPSLQIVGQEPGLPTARATQGHWSVRLWVAIADVAHYVEEGGFLDAEARRRGNSYYFPDRAIPMLPERLSGDLCSLRPEVDRRAWVVELRMDESGNVLDALFHEAWIRSRARLSYEEAAALHGRGEAALGDREWGASIRLLDQIAHALFSARQQAGALMLDLPELRVVVDASGRVQDVRPSTRNAAHMWIEEAMLAANRAVARALDVAGRTAIHRIHPSPQPARLAELERVLSRFGLEHRGDLSQPGVLAEVLRQTEGLPAEEQIHYAALRALSQARYAVESAGHYALRFEHYVHFTSPIRRYADLMVHRALRRWLRGEAESATSVEAAGERAEGVALWLSARERIAQEAERDAVSMASCALMADRVGERFDARVVGLAKFGIFVRLDQPAVEGLLPLRAVEGTWILDPAGDALVSTAAGRRVQLGDPVGVRLVDVDPDRVRLTFGLAGRLGRRRRHEPGAD